MTVRIDDAILSAVDELRDDIVDLTTRLIAFRTVASRGDEYEECAKFISDRLTEDGLQTQTLEVPHEFLAGVWGENLERSREYLEVERFSPRPIVLAKWAGSVGSPSLHLTQHYDLTEPKGSSYEAHIENGRIVGKGASQARAGTVAQIMATRALKRAGVELRGDLFVSATPDNHIGGDTGAGYLVQTGQGKSDFVITGGPSGPDVVTLGYKGCLWLKITVRGKKAHGSEPQEGINAIENMVKIQRGLMDLNGRYASRSSSWPIDPAESNRPTLVMSRLIADGVTVPDKCALYIDRRLTPEESVREAIQDIQDVIDAVAADDDQVKAELEPLHVVENPATPPDSRLAAALMKNIRGVLRTEPKTAIWTYYTEFRCFPAVWGSETVNYSPGLPKVYRGPDEYVDIDDLVNGTKILALTIRDLIG